VLVFWLLAFSFGIAFVKTVRASSAYYPWFTRLLVHFSPPLSVVLLSFFSPTPRCVVGGLGDGLDWSPAGLVLLAFGVLFLWKEEPSGFVRDLR